MVAGNVSRREADRIKTELRALANITHQSLEHHRRVHQEAASWTDRVLWQSPTSLVSETMLLDVQWLLSQAAPATGRYRTPARSKYAWPVAG